MSETKYLGVASAWKEGEQWFYVTDPNAADNGAAQVELFALDGEVFLHNSTARTGGFIRGAIDVRNQPRLR
jgi:hypothetical protein